MRIFLLPALLVGQALNALAMDPVELAPGVLLVGTIKNLEISESSGLIPSPLTAGAFWTHNDNGKDFLYAITAKGRSLGKWKIKDVDLKDWEDIARGTSQLYIADIGNNDLLRQHVSVYRIPEPPPTLAGEVAPSRIWRLSYPFNQPFDAEGFFVYMGYGYVVAKDLLGGVVSVYRFPLGASGSYALKPRFALNVDAPIGGADFTKDGYRLAIITDEGAYLFSLGATLPSTGVVEPVLFVSFPLSRMEGCAFTRDGMLVTAETGEILLFTDEQFKVTKGAKTNIFVTQ